VITSSGRQKESSYATCRGQACLKLLERRYGTHPFLLQIAHKSGKGRINFHLFGNLCENINSNLIQLIS
jgi:hypothetical protein